MNGKRDAESRTTAGLRRGVSRGWRGDSRTAAGMRRGVGRVAGGVVGVENHELQLGYSWAEEWQEVWR